MQLLYNEPPSEKMTHTTIAHLANFAFKFLANTATDLRCKDIFSSVLAELNFPMLAMYTAFSHLGKCY